MEHVGECLNCVELKTFLQVEKKKVSQKNRLITLLRTLVKSYEAKDLNLTLNDLSRIYESSASEVNILKQRLSLYLNENHELLQLKNETSSRNDFLEKKCREVEEELSHVKFVNKQLSDYYREKEANDNQHKDRLKKLAKKLLVYEPKHSEARKILNLQNTPIESDQKSLKSENKKKAEDNLKGMKTDDLSNELTTADAKSLDNLQLEALDTSINSKHELDINDINSCSSSEERSDTPNSMQDVYLDEKINEEGANIDALVNQNTLNDKENLENTCQDMKKQEKTIISTEVNDNSLNLVGNISESGDFSPKMSKDCTYSNIEMGEKSPFKAKSVGVKRKEVKESYSRNQNTSGQKEVEIRCKDSIDTFEFDNSLPDLISPLKSDDHTAVHILPDHEETISEYDAVSYDSFEQLNSSDNLSENIANKKNDKRTANIKNECFSSKSDQVDKGKKSPAGTNYKLTNDDFTFNKKHISDTCFPVNENYNSNYQFQFQQCTNMSCCNNTFDSRTPIVLKLYNCSNVEISIPSSSQKQDMPILAFKDKNNMEKSYINTSTLVNKLVESYWLRSSFTTLRTNDTKKKKCSEQPLLTSPICNKHFFCSSSCNCKENLKRTLNPYSKGNDDELKNSGYYFLDYILSNDIISESISSPTSDSEEDVKCGRLFPIKLGKQFDIEEICSSFQNLTINCSLPKHTFVNFEVSKKTKIYNEGNSSLLSISKPPIFHNALQKTLVSKSGNNDWILGKNCGNINQQKYSNRVALKPSNFLNSNNDKSILNKRNQNGNLIHKQTPEPFKKMEHFSNQKTKNINVYDTLKTSIPATQFYQNSCNQLHEKNEQKTTKQPINSVGFDVHPEKHSIPKKESRVMMQSWIGLKSSTDHNFSKTKNHINTHTQLETLNKITVDGNKEKSSNCDDAFSSSVGGCTRSVFDLHHEKEVLPKVSETATDQAFNKQNVVDSQKLSPNTLPQTQKNSDPDSACLQERKCTRSVFDLNHKKDALPKVSETATDQAFNKQNVESKKSSFEENTLPQTKKGLASDPEYLLGRDIKECTRSDLKLDHEKDVSPKVSETATGLAFKKQKKSRESSPKEKTFKTRPKKGLALDQGDLVGRECKKSVFNLESHEKDVLPKVSETYTNQAFKNQKTVEVQEFFSEEKTLLQTKKCSALDPRDLIGRGAVDIKPKEKLNCEQAALPKYEMYKPAKKPKLLKNVSKTDDISPKKSIFKKISGVKISENRPKINSYRNKDCKSKITEESNSKMIVEVNHKDEFKKFSTDTDKSDSETRLTNTECKLSSNSKVINISDATIPPMANNVHASHNTFTDEEDDCLDSELQEIFKEIHLVQLLSPLRLTPVSEISVEKETLDASNVDKELKENSNYINSRNVSLPSIMPETKMEDINKSSIEKITEISKEEHLNSKTSKNIMEETGCIDDKLESFSSSEDLNKYNIFYDENDIFDVQNTIIEESVSPVHELLNGLGSSIRSDLFLEEIEPQNNVKTGLIINNDSDTGIEPYFSICNNSYKHPSSTDEDKTSSTLDVEDKISSPVKDDELKIHSSVQDFNDDRDKGNVNVSGYDKSKTSISLGFYVNRSDLECTNNSNETSLHEEAKVECFNLSKQQNPAVKLPDTQIDSPITCDTKDSNTLVEDICQEDLPILKEEIRVYKRKLVHNEQFKDMNNKKQKTTDNGIIKEENTIYTRNLAHDEFLEDLNNEKQKNIKDNRNISCENDVFICALKYLSELATTNQDDISAFRKPSPDDILKSKIAINHIKNLIFEIMETALNNYDIMNNTVKKIKQVIGVTAVTLAKAIIEIISEKNETEEIIKSKILIPSMTKNVKLCLLIAVSFIGYNRDLVMEFLQVFEQYIPSFDDKSLTVKEGSQLAVFYTAFCRSYNLDYKVKCLIFDVLYTRNLKAYPFVYRIIQTWPDVIPSSQCCSSKDCLLTETIIFILLSGTSTVDERLGQGYCTVNIRNYLHKHFGYDCNATRRDELSEKIIKRITSRGGSLALVLLCKCESWEWSCTVVQKKLIPLLKSYNSAQMDEYTLCEYILTLGRIVRGFPSTKSAHYVKQTLELLNDILQSSSSTHLSEVVIEAISLLRRHNLMTCTSILMKWKPITKQVTKNTMNHIKSILNVKNIMHWKHVYSFNSTDTNNQNKRTFRNKRRKL